MLTIRLIGAPRLERDGTPIDQPRGAKTWALLARIIRSAVEGGIEASHLSQQLGILRRGGLVVSRREATTVFYSLRNPLLVELLAVARKLLLSWLEETNDLLRGLKAEEVGR